MPENFYDTQYTELLRIVQPKGVQISALLDDLYARPTASLVTGSDVSTESAIGASIGDPVMVDSSDSAPSVLYSIAAMLSSSPLFSFSSNPVTARSGDALTSVPAYLRMLRDSAAADEGEETWDDAAAATVEDLPLDAWHLRLHPSVSSLERRCFLQRISSCGWPPDDFESRNTGTMSVQKGVLCCE